MEVIILYLQWHPTPVLLPGKSHGWRSLEGCSTWGPWGSDMTDRLHFHFSLSCIGEGNGNPLQCSCLENLRDGVAVYGVAQSWTRLKRLSSSSIIYTYTYTEYIYSVYLESTDWYNAYNIMISEKKIQGQFYVVYDYKYVKFGNL